MGGRERRVYLAGLSGVGKTAAAERIAGWLGWPWYDVDREVERRAGRTVAELWAAAGEPAFRRAERSVVEALIRAPGPGVLALGGGTLEDEASRELLAAWGTGVWLDAPPETLAARCAASDRSAARPLLAGRDPVRALREMAAVRGPRFAGLPWRVDANGRPGESGEVVAVEAIRALPWPAPERIAEGVWLGRNALAHAGPTLAEAEPDLARGRAVVATDDCVWPLHGAALARGLAAAGWEAIACPLPAGEGAKTPAVLARLWQALADQGAGRDEPVLVLGGGAAGDVGGLAAATFKRGLPLVLFPTTLLAQVDAAIGGKNAVNLSGIKNIVGTFHFPVAVVVDSFCLLTLPERDYRSGWAEVVKAGVIGDPDLLALCGERSAELLARRLDPVEEALRRAVAVKTAVVAADPRDEGRRAALNLGHTIGHALEA
ncbi:MAG TPA: shikimate kinase, partial [Gemmatimonadota bacterium]|nr:shikimate kinase [Gemmatimonadota bacterium]